MQVQCLKCKATASSHEAALADYWAVIGTVSRLWYFCPDHHKVLASFICQGTFMAEVDRDRILSMIPEMPSLEPGEPVPPPEPTPPGLDELNTIVNIGHLIADSLDPSEPVCTEPQF